MLHIPNVSTAFFFLYMFVFAVRNRYANTAFLNEFKAPLGHTFVRFAGAAVLSGLALGPSSALALVRSPALSAYTACGLLLFTANFANSYALSLTGITMT